MTMTPRYITSEEWRELLTLEYVLTWGYTNEPEKDLKRYRELTKMEVSDLIIIESIKGNK